MWTAPSPVLYIMYVYVLVWITDAALANCICVRKKFQKEKGNWRVGQDFGRWQHFDCYVSLNTHTHTLTVSLSLSHTHRQKNKRKSDQILRREQEKEEIPDHREREIKRGLYRGLRSVCVCEREGEGVCLNEWVSEWVNCFVKFVKFSRRWHLTTHGDASGSHSSWPVVQLC